MGPPAQLRRDLPQIRQKNIFSLENQAYLEGEGRGLAKSGYAIEGNDREYHKETNSFLSALKTTYRSRADR
jgi:hypothetical protein